MRIQVYKGVGKTVLKTHPIQVNASAGVPGFKAFNCNELDKDGKPTSYAVTKVIRDIAQHAKIEFDPHLTIGGAQYKHLYIFAPHWQGVTAILDAQVATASPLSPAGSSIIQRPAIHYVQRNNYDWQDDSSASSLRYGGVQCGLTSAAIVLSEPGVLTDKQIAEIKALSPTGNFDDGVAAIFKKIGAQSISMEGHQSVFRYFGIDADCSRTATVADLKEHIEKYGNAVLGTLYGGGGDDASASGGGHFVASTGFDIKKNLMKILDPFGIRDKESTNHWVKKFNSEQESEVDWWGAGTMADLWATTEDGWCVLPKPKGRQIVLSSAPQSNIVQAPTLVSTTGEEPPETIKILADTWLKARIANASDLPSSEKEPLKAGAIVPCSVIGAKQSHGVLKMPDGSTKYIYNQHFEGQEHKAGYVANTSARSCVDPVKLKNALEKLCPDADDIDDFVSAFLANAGEYTITKREHAIHFLAQCLHESAGLVYLEELASGAAYDYREDLGNCEPEAIAAAERGGMSVGRWFKGHGTIQVTGYTNHLKFGQRNGIDAVNNPHLLSEYPGALLSALDFWATRNPTLSDDVDKGGMNEATVTAITHVVNGGENGLDERIAYFNQLNKLL